jgi:HPt (histidine-containing phosphotransfer) domain-containing protein
MDDSALAAELIELFLSDTPLQLAALSSGIDQSDAEATRRSAHQLKGGCLTIGAGRMAEICEQLEVACVSHSLGDLSRLGKQLSGEFMQVKNELRDPTWQRKLLPEVPQEDVPRVDGE